MGGHRPLLTASLWLIWGLEPELAATHWNRWGPISPQLRGGVESGAASPLAVSRIPGVELTSGAPAGGVVAVGSQAFGGRRLRTRHCPFCLRVMVGGVTCP